MSDIVHLVAPVLLLLARSQISSGHLPGFWQVEHLFTAQLVMLGASVAAVMYCVVGMVASAGTFTLTVDRAGAASAACYLASFGLFIHTSMLGSEGMNFYIEGAEGAIALSYRASFWLSVEALAAAAGVAIGCGDLAWALRRWLRAGLIRREAHRTA